MSIRKMLLHGFGQRMYDPNASRKKGDRTCYSIHDCAAKDKKFWKGETYIAKQGDLVYQKGYTAAHIAKMIHWGKKLSQQAGMTIPRKIVLMKDLTEHSGVYTIYDAIVGWYQDENKNYPEPKLVERHLHNIYMIVSKEYRDRVRIHTIANFSHMLAETYGVPNLI